MMLTTVISGFVLALAAPALHRISPRWTGTILCLLPLSLTVYYAGYIGTLTDGAAIVEHHQWIPRLAVSLSIYLDGLSLLFALLICGVGTLIVLYSGGYLAGHTNLGRFYLYILSFMASMLGLVMSGNLVTLFIFWELTSLTSYFLIGFDHHRESARTAALQALLVTGIGGLALLAGILLLGSIGNSLEIHELLTRGDIIRSHHLYLPMLILVLLGAFTKSAQFPFHFWLPSAMEGPAPVSAFLHSVTMVKAGVYLLLRLNPILGATDMWTGTLTVFGAITMVSGAGLALYQTDMKRLLAYTTVNGLGTLVFLIGLGSPTALSAATVYLVSHALYKGSLFMSAGVVDHATGSRDVRHLGGLRHELPLITVAVVLAAMSMAGLPPLIGFISKELIYESVLKAPSARIWLTLVAVAANVCLWASTAVMTIKPFFAKPVPVSQHIHRPSVDLLPGPLLPAVGGLLVGGFPFLIDNALLTPVVTAIAAAPATMHLALWHGFNPMLLLSLVTIAGGVLLYIAHPQIIRRTAGLAWIGAVGPNRWYFVILDGVKNLAAWQTRLFQSGYLHHYVMTILLTAVILVGFTLIYQNGLIVTVKSSRIEIFEGIICALMIAAAVVTVRAKSRLSAVVAMGVIGYGLVLLFIDFGAPDLATTQLIIETMTVILFVLIIYRLPRYKIISNPIQKISNAVIAIASGCLMTVLVLVALSVQEGSRLAGFFKENSYLMAHGRNIVNVIIVDFRALDTLGEITVLSLAAIGTYALLKLRPQPKTRRNIR